MVTAKVSDVELETSSLRKKIEVSSKMHAKTEAGFARDLREMCDGLEKKTGHYDALRAKLAILRKEWLLYVMRLQLIRRKKLDSSCKLPRILQLSINLRRS